MRKLIVFNLITIDGYFAGLGGNIDWHNVDDEFNTFAAEQTSTFDTFIFGRETYEMFAEYWPKALKDPNTSDDDRKVAQVLEDGQKIVFSTTLKEVSWNNSKLYHEIDAKEIQRLKEQPGKDMVIFGSGVVVEELTALKLIDEYRFLVNPIILGKGKPMFSDERLQTKLKLVSTREFKNGNVLLTYSRQ